jgi:hypothetical protein
MFDIVSIIITIRRIFSFLAALSFGISLGSEWASMKRARKIMEWPSTRGRIIKNEMKYDYSYRLSFRLGDFIRRHEIPADSATGTGTFTPVIEYEYEVDGVTRRGSRIAFGSSFTHCEHCARKILEQYPQGAEVDVFYDGANPDDALLDKVISLNDIYTSVIFHLACLIAALYFAIHPRALGHWGLDLLARIIG